MRCALRREPLKFTVLPFAQIHKTMPSKEPMMTDRRCPTALAIDEKLGHAAHELSLLPAAVAYLHG
jgi:hypothetical protein